MTDHFQRCLRNNQVLKQCRGPKVIENHARAEIEIVRKNAWKNTSSILSPEQLMALCRFTNRTFIEKIAPLSFSNEYAIKVEKTKTHKSPNDFERRRKWINGFCVCVCLFVCVYVCNIWQNGRKRNKTHENQVKWNKCRSIGRPLNASLFCKRRKLLSIFTFEKPASVNEMHAIAFEAIPVAQWLFHSELLRCDAANGARCFSGSFSVNHLAWSSCFCPFVPDTTRTMHSTWIWNQRQHHGSEPSEQKKLCVFVLWDENKS